MGLFLCAPLDGIRVALSVWLGYCPRCGKRKLGTRTWYDHAGHRRHRTYCHHCAWTASRSRGS